MRLEKQYDWSRQRDKWGRRGTFCDEYGQLCRKEGSREKGANV